MKNKLNNYCICCAVFFLISLTNSYSQENSNFYLASNGETCMCPNAEYGDSGSVIINGVEKVFTKRTRQELGAIIFNNENDPQISLTCTSGMTDMSELFFYSIFFNQNLNYWDVSQVTDMNQMFLAAISFNQPLNNWDVSNVTNISGMFYEATSFNQDLSDWSFNASISLNDFISNTALSNQNYDFLLQSFDNQNITDLRLISYGIGYCDIQTRSNLIDNKGWTIVGDLIGQCGENFSPSSSPFVTTWTVQEDLSVDIYTVNAYDYNFTIDWGDGQINQNVTSDITHNYANPGTYTISITGVFPYFKTCKVAVGPEFLACQNDDKLSSIDSWGNQEWRNMQGSFRDAKRMVLNTSEIPNLNNVLSMRSIFSGATSFNQSINNWDTSNVEDMVSVFSGAGRFNKPLDNWDVSKVTTMAFMFNNATNFNQPIDNWNVGNVTDMHSTFRGASNFNQQLNSWDVSNVVIMNEMFAGFSGSMVFNQSLNNWDVSNVLGMGLMFFNAESFNQPLNLWDVSNVIYMSFMFRDASSFSQDISMWCVEQIPQEPIEFALNSALQNNYMPNWGSNCETLLVSEFDQSSITIYPNPSNNYLRIDTDNIEKIEQLKIYDIQGQLVKIISDFDKRDNSIDMSDLASGNYLISIFTVNQKQVTKRVVVK